VVEQIRMRSNARAEPRLLEVEITEASARDVDHCAEVLGRRHLGVSFPWTTGTGYCPQLSPPLPGGPREAGQLLRTGHHPQSGRAAIAAVIAMSHGLHLTVVAEGVETDQQLEFAGAGATPCRAALQPALPRTSSGAHGRAAGCRADDARP
jgi:predicted signal transduction protein with EAL and GGDEF domain